LKKVDQLSATNVIKHFIFDIIRLIIYVNYQCFCVFYPVGFFKIIHLREKVVIALCFDTMGYMTTGWLHIDNLPLLNNKGRDEMDRFFVKINT
jgi:hypothetical protein